MVEAETLREAAREKWPITRGTCGKCVYYQWTETMNHLRGPITRGMCNAGYSFDTRSDYLPSMAIYNAGSIPLLQEFFKHNTTCFKQKPQ